MPDKTELQTAQAGIQKLEGLRDGCPQEWSAWTDGAQLTALHIQFAQAQALDRIACALEDFNVIVNYMYADTQEAEL